MGILFWYILRQYLTILLMCQIGLTTIYLVVDFFEKLRKFLKYNAELLTIFTYFLYKIPSISFQLAPLAALMATLLTIGILNKNQEITAMRSCGFSFMHAISPFIIPGILVTILLLAGTAVIIPLANKHAEYTKTVEIQKKPAPVAFTAKNLWLRIAEDTILNIGIVDQDGSTLHNIRLYYLDQNFTLQTLIEAKHAQHTAEGWILHAAIERQVTTDGHVVVQQHPTFPLNLSLTVEDFKTWISLEPQHMTLHALRKHITQLKNEGLNISVFLTDYWGRIAFACVTFIMTILGVALGFMQIGTRSSSVSKGIGQALGIGFLFWTTHSVGIALGHSGALLPVVGGWIACFMLLAVSLNLFLKVRY